MDALSLLGKVWDVGDSAGDVGQILQQSAPSLGAAPQDSALVAFDSEFGSLGAGDVSTPGMKFDGQTSPLDEGLANKTPGTAGLKGWVGKSLDKIMPALMARALMPTRTPTAPLGGSGHGINANTSGYDSLLKQASHLGENDPLQGLSGFKNLL